jgi:hypothetical protein
MTLKQSHLKRYGDKLPALASGFNYAYNSGVFRDHGGPKLGGYGIIISWSKEFGGVLAQGMMF